MPTNAHHLTRPGLAHPGTTVLQNSGPMVSWAAVGGQGRMLEL